MNFRHAVLFTMLLLQVSFLTEEGNFPHSAEDVEIGDSLHAELLPQHAFKALPPGNYSGISGKR